MRLAWVHTSSVALVHPGRIEVFDGGLHSRFLSSLFAAAQSKLAASIFRFLNDHLWDGVQVLGAPLPPS